MLGIPSALAAVLATATIALAAPLTPQAINHTTPLNTTSPFHAPAPCPNSTTPANTTHALGFWDFLTGGDPLAGTVNFYSRADCPSACQTPSPTFFAVPAVSNGGSA